MQLIREKGGFLSFDEYMRESLYHPDHGYYMSGRPKIGKAGDFYTASSISSLYGALMAGWFLDKVRSNEIPPVFCEIGSGTGSFLRAFLDEWKAQSPETFERGTVFSVEKSPAHRQRARELGVKVLPGIEDLPAGFSGTIFSNEWLDALPVKLAENSGGVVMEAGVGADQEGQLVFMHREDNNGELASYLRWAEIPLKKESRIEIPLEMLEKLQQLNEKLGNAYIVTADYGHFSDLLVQRKQGTIRGYRNHILYEHPLAYPYEMDLTYDIPLTAYLKKTGELGWEELAVQKQTEFFWDNGLAGFLQEVQDPDPFSVASKRNRAIRSLLSHEGISESFYIMVHRKGAV